MAIVHQSEELDNGDRLTEVSDSDWTFVLEHSEPSTEADTSLTAKDDGAEDTYSKSPRVELYDSGATCHMSPDRERFLTYTLIAPRAISGANQERFYAVGKGDMLVTVPNGTGDSTIRLTEVLHAPKNGSNINLHWPY
jgi:hypothetical protein